MKAIINQSIEKVSKYPLETFGKPTLIISSFLSLISAALIYYCLTLPLNIQTPTGVQEHTLGSLLWKARTNKLHEINLERVAK